MIFILHYKCLILAVQALEHQQAAGTPHYTGAFSSSSPVYSVHGKENITR